MGDDAEVHELDYSTSLSVPSLFDFKQTEDVKLSFTSATYRPEKHYKHCSHIKF